MINSRNVAASTILLLAVTLPAHAQVLTVTGGSIAATAQAGETGYTIGTDTPAPMTVQAVGLTSLTAAANGTAVPEFPPTPFPVSTSAGGTVDVTNDVSGTTTLALTSRASESLLLAGPGSYCCGSSSATDTVFFSLGAPTQLALDWTGGNPDGGSNANQGRLFNVATDAMLYYANNSSANPSMTTDLLLPAGQYEAILESVNGAPQGAPATFTESADLTITAPAPVPVPGAIWLLGSGLLSLSALRTRGRR